MLGIGSFWREVYVFCGGRKFLDSGILGRGRRVRGLTHGFCGVVGETVFYKSGDYGRFADAIISYNDYFG